MITGGSILTPAESLAALDKPALELVNSFNLGAADLLIACCGFEERALAILKSAILNNTQFRVLLIEYEPNVTQNRGAELREVCRRAGIQPLKLTYDRHSPAGFGETLIDLIAQCNGQIYIDVSAMSRLLIVQIIVALSTRNQSLANCVVAYAEAKSYPPSKQEAEAELAGAESTPTTTALFLSSGVYEIAIMSELSSPSIAETQTRLIAFPSLDAHHLIALRAELQPSRFTFIEGEPPSTENKWRKTIISKLNGLDQIQNAERLTTSTLKYRETLDCLLEIYAKHAIRQRLLISPTGSKMQTIAVAIFRSFVKDVQIVYPTAQGYQYPSKYTCGIGPLHRLSLDTFAKLRE